MSKWMYLTDLAPQGTVLNLETGETRTIVSIVVQDRAPSGLRRYLLEETDGGHYKETGEWLPMTPDLADQIDEHYCPPNSWNYDWPHVQVESEGDENVSLREFVSQRLHQLMAPHPYEFAITGLQRRYLMYYSDGSMHSQQRFEQLIPRPESNPFGRTGRMQTKYTTLYNSIMRDAGVPLPPSVNHSSSAPCLYSGPAWVVRFTLDGQDVLEGRCRVYVKDTGEFICSDWCQRHDFSSYGNGINLQTGIYTFDGWVTGPCMIKNMQSGNFTPRETTFTRTAIRDVMKRAVHVPSFDEAFKKAQAAVNLHAQSAEPAPQSAPAGPITADVLAEAMAAAEQLISKKSLGAAAPYTDADVAKNHAADVLYAVPYRQYEEGEEPYEFDDIGYVISYTVCGKSAGYPVIRATRWYSGTSYKDTTSQDGDVSEGCFIVDEDSPTGFWYGKYHPTALPEDEYCEQLNTHWWLWSAAVYYNEHLAPSATVSAVLLEA